MSDPVPHLFYLCIFLRGEFNRWTYIGTGITHPKFLETVSKIASGEIRRIEDAGPVFC